jgi:hypothetical protein
MLFVLAWFHAIVLERRTYIPQGWTKIYEFLPADMRSGADIIDLMFDRYLYLVFYRGRLRYFLKAGKSRKSKQSCRHSLDYGVGIDEVCDLWRFALVPIFIFHIIFAQVELIMTMTCAPLLPIWFLAITLIILLAR